MAVITSTTREMFVIVTVNFFIKRFYKIYWQSNCSRVFVDPIPIIDILPANNFADRIHSIKQNQVLFPIDEIGLNYELFQKCKEIYNTAKSLSFSLVCKVILFNEEEDDQDIDKLSKHTETYQMTYKLKNLVSKWQSHNTHLGIYLKPCGAIKSVLNGITNDYRLSPNFSTYPGLFVFSNILILIIC